MNEGTPKNEAVPPSQEQIDSAFNAVEEAEALLERLSQVSNQSIDNDKDEISTWKSEKNSLIAQIRGAQQILKAHDLVSITSRNKELRDRFVAVRNKLEAVSAKAQILRGNFKREWEENKPQI